MARVRHRIRGCGAGLKSLSLHRHQVEPEEEGEESETLEPEHFMLICYMCLNLEQLGFRIPDEWFTRCRFQEMLDYLVSFPSNESNGTKANLLHRSQYQDYPN